MRVLQTLLITGVLILSASLLSVQPLQAEQANIYAPVSLGDLVVNSGKRICFTNQEIIIGSCWDFINAVYTRAGFGEGKRSAVFKSTRKGPFAPVDQIKPGDWIMFINHEYGDIEHSAIFIEWIDKDQKLARTMGYVGERRARVGEYYEHVIDSVFTIVRPKLVQRQMVK